MASILASSSASFVATSSPLSLDFARRDPQRISSGVKPSSPKSKRKGENPIAREVVVLRDQSTLSRSLDHLPFFAITSLCEMEEKMFSFCLSTTPFVRGWYTEAKHSFVP